MSAITLFDPYNTPLLKGINLCDASAGTGKTFAIAMLVLRFVVEQQIDIKQILVVTFTKAATEELKERIRKRLQQAKNTLNTTSPDVDNDLVQWVRNLNIPNDQIKQRLDLALLDIDQAGIFTIHGFCQRVLREHALESGQLFDVELTADIALLKQACTDDFWRTSVYARSPWQAAVITLDYPTPEALLSSLPQLRSCAQRSPDVDNLDQLLHRLVVCCKQALLTLELITNTIVAQFANGNFKQSYTENFVAQTSVFRLWLEGCCVDVPLQQLTQILTTTGVKNGLNGNKFKTTKTQTAEQRKADFFDKLGLDFSVFDTLSETLLAISLAWRLGLYEYLNSAVEQKLQQLNVIAFDDLISRFAYVVRSDQRNIFCNELQNRYRVALIDEFQDTDHEQWIIFSTLFGQQKARSLYLIGDPKQAIYKFRGADIYSYFEAQQQSEHQFTLGFNWRSHPHLVVAINSIFQREQPFLFPQVEFHPVLPARTEQEGNIVQDGKLLPPLHLWQLEPSQSNDGYWTPGKASVQIRYAVINEILQLLGNNSFIQQDNAQRRVRPKHIAILLKTNQQAREYQIYLRAAGIPAVLNSTESVFVTAEAMDLYRLLLAIANPADATLVKQALSLPWFGLKGQQLYRLINDEIGMDAWVIRLQDYAQLWLKQGLMAMMRQLLSRENVFQHLAKTTVAERSITNLNHLIELLQQAVLDEHLGVQKTVEWLRNNLTTAQQVKNSVDEQQLRLESDEDAIKLVTMHRSKGLEYTLVFCPYLWNRSAGLSKENQWVQCHEEGSIVLDFGSQDFARRKKLALKEELAEELRVFYVAVTRAQLRCYIPWANVRTKEKPNDSAMAYLFGLSDGDFRDQQERLLKLVSDNPLAFHYQRIPAVNAIESSYQTNDIVQLLAARSRKRALFTTWQMSSYTALSALSLKEMPELPEDKADEQSPSEKNEISATALPHGAGFGNAVHSLLENVNFARLAQSENIKVVREQVCQRFGLKLEQPELLDELLRQIVTTSLSKEHAFYLKNLGEQYCLKELPFYLAMAPMDASAINAVLENCPVYQALTAKQMCGYLTGFIDLVCCFQEQYYVIDYKTNLLPDYQVQQLNTAMREHNYGLQYWLYSLVLHQYLKQRIPHYDYNLHFGGVRYLFVRGMRSNEPMSGVFSARPELQQLERLAMLFSVQ